jgi:hypothetical protein
MWSNDPPGDAPYDMPEDDDHKSRFNDDDEQEAYDETTAA